MNAELNIELIDSNFKEKPRTIRQAIILMVNVMYVDYGKQFENRFNSQNVDPETGENFSGLNQARDYFNRKAQTIDFPKQKKQSNTQGTVQGKKDENL